jgi:hypothetical protein
MSDTAKAAPPLFASAVARRKWEKLQAEGHRMQRLYFERADGSSGTIDAWGKVLWTDAAPPAAGTVTFAELMTAIDTFGRRPDRLNRAAVESILRTALAEAAAPPAAQTGDELPPFDVQRLQQEVGRLMIAMTTTVRGPDEWLAILWQRCMEERDEAIAAIAARGAQAGDGREAWIPVTERLPDEGAGEVLVWLTGGRCAFDEWRMHREDPTGMGGPTMEMGFMWRDYDFEEVTHWMPLPDAPGEQG